MSDGPYYGGGGGGFLASPYGGSQTSPGEAKKSLSPSLRPVTILQILNATQMHSDAEFVIDDHEVTQVTFVAQVKSIVPQATNIVYALVDGTGQIEARHWAQAQPGSEELQQREDVKEMSYVRVLGTLKTFGGKRHVSTQRLRPVSDPHEVYFHLLEALDVHLQATSGIPSDTHVGNAGAASAYTGGGATSTGHDQYASLPPIHKAIVQFIINTPHGAEGVNVAAIARHVAGQGTTGQQVADAIESLMEDGHIYATIDESHFAVS